MQPIFRQIHHSCLGGNIRYLFSEALLYILIGCRVREPETKLVEEDGWRCLFDHRCGKGHKSPFRFRVKHCFFGKCFYCLRSESAMSFGRLNIIYNITVFEIFNFPFNRVLQDSRRAEKVPAAILWRLDI